ncbi:MAG: endonuclease domain-containing protein, partial [Anaerolineales bacterium]
GYHFRRQQVIEGFIADFYCYAAGLVVEIDGKIHQTQTHYDDARDQVLIACGLRVIRIPNALVRQNLQAVLTLILSACQEPDSPSLSGIGLGDIQEANSPSLSGKGPGVRS